MWMMPLHLHVNQKSDYDDYDDDDITMMNLPFIVWRSSNQHAIIGGNMAETKFIISSVNYPNKQKSLIHFNKN